MKNTIKQHSRKILKISTVIVIVGLITTFIGAASMDFDLNIILTNGDIENIEYKEVEKTYSPLEEKISVIDLNVIARSVEIVPSIEDKIKVTFSMDHFTSEVKNGILDVTEIKSKTDSRKWYNVFNFNNEIITGIKIEVPETFIGDIDIVNSYGNVQIKDISGIRNIVSNNNSGNINLSNIKLSGLLTLSTKYGNIKILNSEVNASVKLEEGSGSIIADKFKCEEFEVKSQYGDIRLSNIDAKGLSMDSTSGEVKLNSLNIENMTKIELINGDLRVKDIIAPNIEFKTTSGDIDAVIKGKESQYKIYSETKYGDNNLRNKNTGEKEIKVSAKHGDIDIKFTEE
ncbi:MAG: DUF4097 family beta strand repeat-containing protein [Clostridium sp.]